MSCAAHSLALTRLFLKTEDVDLIRRLVSELPEVPVVIDIGAGSGTTALAVFAERELAHVTTIDHDQANIDWAALAVENAGFRATWASVTKDSVEAAAIFKNNGAHMIMLDTSHTHHDTRAEIAAWLPKLRSKGIFWFHDYIGSGVNLAVNEAVQLGLLKEISQEGLGWAGWKP